MWSLQILRVYVFSDALHADDEIDESRGTQLMREDNDKSISMGLRFTTHNRPAGRDVPSSAALAASFNKSLQATRDGRSSSAIAEDVIDLARLSSGRYPAREHR